MRTAAPLPIPEEDARVLRGWVDRADGPPVLARRARIVLLAADGLGPAAIAARLGCAKQTAILWRERYRVDGLDGLRDAPRSGRPPSVDDAAVVARTLQAPPREANRWTTRSLASALGVSNGSVAAMWRSWGLEPAEGGAVRFVTDPPLVEPVRDVLGLLATPRLRLLAVAPSGGPERAPAPHPEVVPRLAALVAASAPPGPSGAPEPDPAAFLAAVARMPGCRLVVDSAAAGAPAGARPVHVAAAERWPRMVHVAAALAGAAVVADLAAALDAYLTAGAGAAFAWTRPASSPPPRDG